MKQHFVFKTTTCLLSTVMLFTGCQKVYDYVSSHPDAEIRSCSIRQFIYSDRYSDYEDTITITYNTAGNPVKGTRPDPRTGAPNLLFKYKNGRLSDFIGVYSNGTSTEQWHRYIYGAGDRVLIDSVYVFAEMVHGMPSDPFYRYAITFIYDNKGRILQEKYVYPEGVGYEGNYQYNSEGNRVGAAYGQKVSFRRSNKIWMFLDRDYSVNDRIGSSGHNACYMPTIIDLGETDDHFFNYFNKARISYTCN